VGADGKAEEETEYDLTEWPPADRLAIVERLVEAGVPHRWEEALLLVPISEEDVVDEVLDDIEARWEANGGADDDADDDLVDLDGLDVNELLSTLFDASDRLRRNARDAQGVLRFLDNAPTLERMRMPFGFDRPVWDAVRDSTRALHERLDADDSDDDEVREHAQQLRDLLFGLI
jgi:hypothetical protein